MNKWQIKDLKGVGDVELNLDSNQRVFAFFGTNGVGKTKTLEGIFFHSLLQVIGFIPNKQDYLFENKFFSNIKTKDIDFYLESDNGKVDFSKIFDKNLPKKYEAICYIGTNQRSQIARGIHGNFILRDILGRREILSRTISEAILQNNLKSLGMSLDINEWFSERAKSVNPYQKEEDNRKTDIDSVLIALNKLDDRIEKELAIDGNGNVYLTIEGQERELSSGFLSIIKIIQSIISSYSAFTNEKDLLNIKGVVLIDEIESHLHLEWQIKIISILKNLFPNTIFYITTHSPLVLSQLNEGEAYLLKRDDDNVVRSHLINSPNTRLLENVLQDTFGVNLNELKRQNMANIDQSKAKKKLLDLLNGQVS
ncbi:MAG: AAA family ATPase [Moraxella sp.]|nr:AAA family ATPase [Moraxella sp.]